MSNVHEFVRDEDREQSVHGHFAAQDRVTAQEAAQAAGHPSVYGKPKGQEVTIFLSDEEVDILMRTAGIGRNIPTYSVSDDPMILGYAVHTALRLGVKELDAVARAAITSAYQRAAIRPIRSEF